MTAAKRRHSPPPPPPPGFSKKPKKLPKQPPKAATPAGGSDLDRAFARCGELLDHLMRHEHGWVFNSPVDARRLGLRDYYTVVSDPMDLGTVRHRLARRRYADPLAFAADVRLTFRNAMSYNDRGDAAFEFAAELSRLFESQWPSIAASLPSPSPEPPSSLPFEGKKRLRDELQRLPPEMQEKVVGIIAKRCECLREVDGMVEVDFDRMDAGTLDEVDRFVADYRVGFAGVHAVKKEK